MEKDFLNGKMAHRMKAIMKMIRNMDLVNMSINKAKAIKETGKMASGTARA